MNLNYLLSQQRVDPREVLVMRHSPWEPKLRKVLPWLAAERPDLFKAYQQTQYETQETAMTRAKYLVSLVGHERGKALYVGLYEIGQNRPISRSAYWRIPAHVELRKLGMMGWTSASRRRSRLLFKLNLTDAYVNWKGKLILGWPGGERAWCRWAKDNVFPIDAILEETALVPDMARPNELVLSWSELNILPKTSILKLSEWRGIYFIFNVSNGQGYVGAAYGKENLYGRWKHYVASGHGGNKRLRRCRPQNLRFSILQVVAPDMLPEDVIRLESTWKERLHTREFGLNDN